MTRGVFLLLAGAGVFLFPGCVLVGVDYETPSAGTPDAWTVAIAGHTHARQGGLVEWWTGFEDPVLDNLIARTRSANPDLKLAAQRIAEARALRGVARSQMLPTLAGETSYARNRSSETLFVPPPANPSDLYATGFDAGWEIDIFGGLRRSVEAADATIEASIEDYRDLLVTLFAETALNYIEYRTIEERIRLVSANAEAQSDSVDLAETRLEAGLVPRIDVTQAETNLQTTRSALPLLRTQLAAARNRLATLTASDPSAIEGVVRRSRGVPVPRKGFSAGLPCDLLRARPDVRRAERNLAAQTAQIGVAEADLYPRFTLFGSFSLQSVNGGDLFDGNSIGYSFGPSIRWQIFSSGRIRNLIRAEEARTEQALAAYEKSVLLAVEEVETAMASVANGWDRVAILHRAVGAARETVDLVKGNYREGLIDFQRVLDAERAKFSTEDELAAARGEIAKNYVTLYKALGGGTEVEVIPIPPTTVQARGGPFGFARQQPEVEVRRVKERQSQGD